MRLTLRLRTAIASLTLAGLAIALTPWFIYLWHHLQTVRRVEAFYRSFGDAGDTSRAESARSGIYWSIGLMGVGVVAVLVAAYLLAIWVVRPMRSMTATLATFGPNNLGQRNRLSGRNDELRRLGDAVDEMLDRFTAGYEGQRMFAANASHELRTPLAVQRALIEVSLDDAPTPEQLQLLSRQLLRANERNEALIEGLLVLTESDRGLASSNLIVLDRLVAEVVEVHHDMAKRADVTLIYQAGERVVRGERVLLERLVTNLIQNAIKYNEPGGTVEITVGDDPALVVCNTGELIPAESVAALFEPFRRLTTDRTVNTGGAGLGLTIARSIVQAHEGTINAKPQPAGGLQVEVALPQL